MTYILTGLNGRYRVFDIFKKFASRIDVKVLVVGSSERDRKHCKEFEYIQVPNLPLGNKFNEGVEYLKDKADHIIFLGCDDIFCVEFFKIYEREIKRGTDFMGFLDCYFYDLVSTKAIYWSGYSGSRKKEPIGAFKMLSKKALDAVAWRPFQDLWNSSLDYSMMAKLKGKKLNRRLLNMKQEGVVGVDLKDGDNITKFRLYENSEFVEKETLKQLPEYKLL